MTPENAEATGAPHVVCPACGAVNRLPASRPAELGKCGKCHQGLFIGAPVDVDEAGFALHVGRNDIPVLVDIWAPWCGPCRTMSPQFARAASVLEPGVRLLKLNADNAPNVSAQLGVRGIPSMFLFRGGKVAGNVSGAMDAGAIVNWVRERLRAA